MRRLLVVSCMLSACNFDPGGSSDEPEGTEADADPLAPDARAGGGDAGMGSFGPAPHVPPAGTHPGTSDLTLNGETIDTTELTIDGVAPSGGVVFDSWPQDPSGPELAVLHVRSLSVVSGSTTRVVGSRPLVVLASGPIDVVGLIDAGARGDRPGPNGFGPASGPGTGSPGEHVSNFADSGGGGASFGSTGAGGGGATCGGGCSAQGGGPGAMYGDDAITILQGGSGGGVGAGGGCPAAPAGAGGGAIQLYSQTSISIAAGGGINAGGGGGSGGLVCWPTTSNLPAGSAGGSGGAIVLVAASIDLVGDVTANGGGGGGGAGSMQGQDDPCCYDDGAPGEDGALGSSPAPGGADVGAWSAAGGHGGTATQAAQPGGAGGGDGNGGSGGGGAGRVSVQTL